jgi:hypothetical protein
VSRHANQTTRDSGSHHLPVDLAKLRAQLVAMTRDRGGGNYTPEICPVCGEDRRGERWVGKRTDPDRMCERCFREGREYPTVGQCQAAAESAVRPAATTGRTPRALTTCPECGRAFRAVGLGVHRAKMHRPLAAPPVTSAPVDRPPNGCAAGSAHGLEPAPTGVIELKGRTG